MAFNTFTASTKIRSAKINENFSKIADGSEVASVAWTAYTPTWTADTTNPVIGNGTIQGKYAKIGRKVTFHFVIIMGSTTTYGTGNYILSLPFIASSTLSYTDPMGTLMMYDAAPTGTIYVGVCYSDVSGDATILRFSTHLLTTQVDATNPFVLTTSDQIFGSITYESAS